MVRSALLRASRTMSVWPSFETPRKRAAPQDEEKFIMPGLVPGIHVLRCS
jgi:hypothetical protein